mmetsp:Transcript_22243/g.47282  ORF Transcript_22243/g.47282 Transcript_22243/m.47282 type:complete len:215 (-) Transcript_22243:99-743(-)
MMSSLLSASSSSISSSSSSGISSSGPRLRKKVRKKDGRATSSLLAFCFFLPAPFAFLVTTSIVTFLPGRQSIFGATIRTQSNMSTNSFFLFVWYTFTNSALVKNGFGSKEKISLKPNSPASSNRSKVISLMKSRAASSCSSTSSWNSAEFCSTVFQKPGMAGVALSVLTGARSPSLVVHAKHWRLCSSSGSYCISYLRSSSRHSALHCRSNAKY